MKAISDPTRNVELLTYENKATGMTRNELMTPVTVANCDCHNLYLNEYGNFYTNGIIGWIPVDRYMDIKK